MNSTLVRLLFATAWLCAGAFSALAQKLVAPAEVVLYLQSDLKNTKFVQPLVCALQRVLVAPVSTQTLALRLGPQLRATPTQFDVGKVASLFVRTTADGRPQSFKYLLIPFDLKAEPLPYVFSTSYRGKAEPFYIGILSTARLDPSDPKQEYHQDGQITAMRLYKLILKSIARVAGLRSPAACILALQKSLDELDQQPSEFCPDDRAALVDAGILKSKEGQDDRCIAISHRDPSLFLATARP